MIIELTVHGANRLSYTGTYDGVEYDNLVFTEDDLTRFTDRLAKEMTTKQRAHARNDFVDAVEERAADETAGTGDAGTGEDGSRRATTDLPKTDATEADAEKRDRTRT
jgi:hypothetical protein